MSLLYICDIKFIRIMKNKILAMAVCLGLQSGVWAQDFNDYFVDKTLRIDYLFTGNEQKQQIVLDGLVSLPQWAGRRHHLAELPLDGNGKVTVRDKATNKVIYRTSFSSLFQEWIREDEAKTLTRGYENTFLVPFPKQKVVITTELTDNRREVSATFTHEVDPTDILIHDLGVKSVTPHRYLQKGGNSADCIDVAIMAEGYTREEMDLFYEDANKACKALFNHAPFKENKQKFNIVAVASPSKDSGVSIPRDNVWKETAVGSHFDTFYSERYLTTRSVKAIHNWLAGIPYEHIIILANTDTYGGGGIYNSYTLTTTHNPMFEPVVVHEFGHSFGGLADEYAYLAEPSTLFPLDVEPWEQNITTLVNFDEKWADMVSKGIPIPTPVETEESKKYNKVGLYEGGGYSLKGIYRPTTECRMKINEAPQFCPVCQRALQRIIDFYTKK